MKTATYKPPRANMKVNMIFCDLCICNLQIRGTGKPRSTKSVSICGTEEPIYK